MPFRDYLIVMAIASIAAWTGWIVTLFAINPETTGFPGFALFYLTLSIALIGTLAVAGAGIRVWRNKDELASRLVSRALRQAVLLTILIIGTLLMLGAGVYAFWTVGLLMLFLTLVEMVFLSSTKRPDSHLNT